MITRRQLFFGMLAAPVAVVAVPKMGIVMTGKRVGMTPEQMTAFDLINNRRLALEIRKRLWHALNPYIQVGESRTYGLVVQDNRDKVRAVWSVLRESVRTGLIDNYVVESSPTTIVEWGPKWTIYLEKNGHREFVGLWYMPKGLEHVMERPGKEQAALLRASPAADDSRDAG